MSRGALWAALAVCAAFFAAMFLFVCRSAEIFDHGDIHTDLRAVIAAHQFERVGIMKLHLLQTTDAGAEIGLEPSYYSRHPAGGAIALSLCMDAGMSMGVARVVPLLVSTLGVFCIFSFFREATGSDWVGVLGAAAYATLAPFWLMSDGFLMCSWALAGRAATIWLVAAGCNVAGRSRWWRFIWAGIVAGACIAVGGLETMPSTGFLSFLLPLVLVRDGRIVTAVQSAAMVGFGMVLGLLVHLSNMAGAMGGFLPAWESFSGSLRYRSSLNAISDSILKWPYPVELLRRVWIYAPHVFWFLAAALLASLVVLVVRRRWPAWPGTAALVAALVGEGLYFVGMRNHVTEHYHTIHLLTLTLAAIVTSSGALLTMLVPRSFRWMMALAIVAVLVSTLWFEPLRDYDYGNFIAPAIPDEGRKALSDEIAAEARLMPPNSVVLTGVPTWQWTTIGSELALQGHSMVYWNTPHARGWKKCLERALASGRPVFGMVYREELPAATFAELSQVGRPIVSGRHVALFGVANYDPATIPTFPWPMADSDLKATVFTAPTPADLAAAGIHFPYFGPTTLGVWMSIPGGPLKVPATVGVVPFRPEPGLSRIRAAVASFRYDRRTDVVQPPVVVRFGVRPKPPAESKPSLFNETTIMPGSVAECRVSIPEGVEVSEFEIAARRPDGEESNAGASVNCTQVRFEF